MRLVVSSALALALSASAPAAATFNIFEAGTTTLLGMFEAPAGGGALTSAMISTDGGVFDVLDLGSTAPVYDAASNWITGAMSPFGGISNSVAYATSDVDMNPVNCGIGECVFVLTSSAGMEPPEWSLNFLPMAGPAAVIDFGRYEIAPKPMPLPPTALLLLAGALLGLALLRPPGGPKN